jgi:hypothetical protein
MATSPIAESLMTAICFILFDKLLLVNYFFPWYKQDLIIIIVHFHLLVHLNLSHLEMSINKSSIAVDKSVLCSNRIFNFV